MPAAPAATPVSRLRNMTVACPLGPVLTPALLAPCLNSVRLGTRLRHISTADGGGRMIWFAIALVLFACGGVALWLSRAPRRPAPRPTPHDEPENLFEPRSSREDPSP